MQFRICFKWIEKPGEAENSGLITYVNYDRARLHYRRLLLEFYKKRKACCWELWMERAVPLKGKTVLFMEKST